MLTNWGTISNQLKLEKINIDLVSENRGFKKRTFKDECPKR